MSDDGLPSKLILGHDFVPKHEIMSKKDAEDLLKSYGITKFQLPKIKTEDPVSLAINAKKGDILKILRKSITAGESLYYRLVI